MTIVICQLQLFRWSQKGRMSRPTFQLLGLALYRVRHAGVPVPECWS